MFLKNYSNASILSQNMEVRCYSNENFPNGDNRILELPVAVSLMELLLNVILLISLILSIFKIENRYQRSPISLHYIDEYKEQFNIDNDNILKRAIEKSCQESLSTGEKITLKLIIVSPMSKSLQSYVNSDQNRNIFTTKIGIFY